jgi:sugar phosphate permease
MSLLPLLAIAIATGWTTLFAYLLVTDRVALGLVVWAIGWVAVYTYAKTLVEIDCQGGYHECD